MLSDHCTVDSDGEVRRAYHRFFVPGQAVIRYTPTSGGDTQPMTIVSTIIEVSPEGLMVRSHWDIPLKHKLTILVTLGDDTVPLLGQAVHCTGTVSGYKVGIHLQFDDRENIPALPPRRLRPVDEQVKYRREQTADWFNGPSHASSNRSAFTLPVNREPDAVSNSAVLGYLFRNWTTTLVFLGYVAAISYVVGKLLLPALQ